MSRPAIGFALVNAECGLQRGRGRWDGQPKRPPQKGEYYLSGSTPVAYRAPNDLTAPYFIAVIVELDGKAIAPLVSPNSAPSLADRLDALADNMKRTAQELRLLGG